MALKENVFPKTKGVLRSRTLRKGLKWMTSEQLLNEPGLQVVGVETRVRDLLSVAESCIDAGKHIHLDKPAGESLPQFKRILDAAAKRGIPCCNVQGVNKEAVAEHGMLLILAAARQLIEMHGAVNRAEWPRKLKGHVPQFELVGKTLGIVGLGHTGSQLAKRARAFDMRIVYNDIRGVDALDGPLGRSLIVKFTRQLNVLGG